jgi:hypothetical protein
MSRSGYTDCDDSSYPLDFYRHTVDRSIRGKRGQAFLRDLLAALDAMPEKRLIAHELIENGQVCTLGCAGIAKGVDVSKVDPEDHDTLGKLLNIANPLVREIEYENDEGSYRAEALKAAAVEHEVQIVPKVGHNPINVETMTPVRAWLLAKLKKAE